MVRYPEPGARHPLRDWLLQRLTAALMVLYMLMFLVVLVSAPPVDYSVWRQIFLPAWMKFATLLFFASLYLHAWIGVRNIFMDYIGNGRLRQMLYALAIGALIAYGVWTVQILWGRW